MPTKPLDREEYVEQAHFFRALGERLASNVPAQEVLASVREEVLATTKLPLAIDFLLGELRHAGSVGPAMAQLPHYFTPFQAFVIQESENERLRFEIYVRASNVLNIVNPQNFSGVVTSPFFGMPTSASAARRVVIGTHVRF